MPEYLAPGVFVEEVSFRAKSIEGVSTTTTGFVGATRYGPIDIEPEIVTSLVEFERAYGGKARLSFGDAGDTDNYMWNAVRAFFEEGGKRVYVARAYTPEDEDDPLSGYARAATDSNAASSPPGLLDFSVQARFPGAAGNGRATFTFALGPNRLSRNADGILQLKGAADRDLVWISGIDDFHLALRDDSAAEPTWRFNATDDDVASGLELQALTAAHAAALPARLAPLDTRLATLNSDLANAIAAVSPDRALIKSIRTEIAEVDAERARLQRLDVMTLTVSVQFEHAGGDLPLFFATELPLDPQHSRNNVPDSLFAFFAAEPANLSLARTIPLVIGMPDGATGLDVLRDFQQLHDLALSPPSSPPPMPLFDALAAGEASSAALRSIVLNLAGGTDGKTPLPAAYEGREDPLTNRASGLKAFEALEDISIVAAPGSTLVDDIRSRTVIGNLISHAERMKYRIAVIDSAKGQTISNVRAMRGQFDSSHAAFYYPWVRILDPLTGRQNYYPPSGFVAGIYARNDIERAVYKAPANEVVNLSVGFETMLTKAHQEVLNPEGINCFRFFEGRGNRLWGARTMSSDPEWKYVNLRRYFAFLERSIDKGTQWAVFEPNGELLWANVRSTISDFLLNEWQNGALLGDKPEKSFFVKCDRSTMSQNDLDNGRLVCLVGVAPLRPRQAARSRPFLRRRGVSSARSSQRANSASTISRRTSSGICAMRCSNGCSARPKAPASIFPKALRWWNCSRWACRCSASPGAMFASSSLRQPTRPSSRRSNPASISS